MLLRDNLAFVRLHKAVGIAGQGRHHLLLFFLGLKVVGVYRAAL